MSQRLRPRIPKESNAPPAMDPRYFDRFHYAIRATLERSGTVEPGPPPDWQPANAQEEALAEVFSAYEATDEEQKLAHVNAALARDPDCPDALILRAELTAESPEAAAELYAQARQSAERRLGDDALNEMKGRLWPCVEARPLLRAMNGLAQSLVDQERNREAIRIWRRMLVLDRDDNLGARFFLVHAYLLEGQDDAAREEAIELPEEFAPTWWTRALIAFRLEGDAEDTLRLFARALEGNQRIMEFLLGLQPFPDESLPVYGEPGSEAEAIQYLTQYAHLFLETTGFIEWMALTPEKFGRQS